MTAQHPVLTRPATPEDEPAIRACVRAAFLGYVADMGREPAPMTADYAAHIARGEAHVAEAGGRFLGCAVFFPEDGAMLLDCIAVLPEGHGQGIGRILVTLCEDAARASGLPTLRLCTNAKMTANLTLYPHLGFLRTGRRMEHGFDRVFFEKPLA